MTLKPLVALCAALTLAGCAKQADHPKQAQKDFKLVVAHINDTHSHFNPMPFDFMANGQEVYGQFGGYPRLLTLANQYKTEARKDNEAFLFLHAGDAWQGSAYFKLNKGQMNADLLSMMGLDAMVVGNHEFDLDNARLNAFIGAVNFPLLAANMDVSSSKNLKAQKNLKPYVVFAFDGNKKTKVNDLNNLPKGKNLVAVFGLTMEDMPDIAPHTGNVAFESQVKTAQATVDMLKAKGINNIIALTHLGNSVERDLAAKVNGIDLIVGGHSHSLLGDFTNIGKKRTGTYAEMIRNPNGQTSTCVVQAGKYAQAMGEVTVTFNGQGVVENCTGHNTLLVGDKFYSSPARDKKNLLDAAATQKVESFIAQQQNIAIVQENNGIRQRIDNGYKPVVDAAYGKIIGRVPQDIMHVRRPGDGGSDSHGSDVAPLVAEGQFFWANTLAVTKVTDMNVDFALVGAGGIRTNFDAGQLREGDVSLEMQPFANYMSVLPLKGSVVKQLLQQTITATLPKGAHAGKFPYGGNLRYQFTETTPYKTGKLDFVEVNRGTLSKPNWKPLNDDQIYNVAMTNYNATGNDGWTPLYEAQKDSSGRVDLAFVDGKLTAFPVKNIEMVGEKYKVNYKGIEPNCKASNERCNTDAQALIDFIATQMPVIKPLPYEVVTLNRDIKK